ncbi:MAG: hypothetical protein ACLQAT_21015 [Candidatus Binataceae bacterium]
MKVWKINSADDVSALWQSVREVPGRTAGRKPYQEERYCLGLYLLAQAANGLLKYPLRVEQGESPDFMISDLSGAMIGLEITRATSELLQEAMTWAEKTHRVRVAEAEESGGRPEPVLVGFSKQELKAFVSQARQALGRRTRNGGGIVQKSEPALNGPGWAGDQAENEWVAFVEAAIARKTAKLNTFLRASRHDLLIYDETPVPAVDRRKVVGLLSPWVSRLQLATPLLGKVSVIASLDVLFDIGGHSRIFPYISWSGSQFDSDRVAHAGRIASGRAIREHREKGSPIYSVDSAGRLIKQIADGRRFEVRVLADGREVTEQELRRG